MNKDIKKIMMCTIPIQMLGGILILISIVYFNLIKDLSILFQSFLTIGLTFFSLPFVIIPIMVEYRKK